MEGKYHVHCASNIWKVLLIFFSNVSIQVTFFLNLLVWVIDRLFLRSVWNEISNVVIQFQGTKLTKEILNLTFAATLHKIWDARNKKIHQDNLPHPTALPNYYY